MIELNVSDFIKQWPYNLAYKICPNASIALSISIPGIYNAINSLPEKCRQVIIMQYHYGMNQTQIAEIIKLSRSRVNVVHGEGIRWLRNPSRMNMIRTIPFNKHLESKGIIPIEDMSLSIRAFNCLVRANIRTLEQLESKTFDDLIAIKNMGNITAIEVCNVLSEYGVNIEIPEMIATRHKSVVI